MIADFTTADFLFQLFAVFAATAIASMSPGPDFVMTVRNSMISRRAGLLTAVGFAASELVHVTYCILGIAVLVSQSIILFNVIKFLGAAYLIWIGIQCLKSKGYTNEVEQSTNQRVQLSDGQAFRSGIMTNLLNPKATLFFLALFTQVIQPTTPLWAQIVYGVTAALTTAGWFALVALLLTHKTVREKFLSISRWVDRACGAILIALGLKIVLSRS